MSFIYINADIKNFDNNFFSSSTSALFILLSSPATKLNYCNYYYIIKNIMLGFLYLILILGWVLIIIIIKCKKSITPHLTLNSNLQNIDRRPSVHVIQLSDDNNYMENINHNNNSHNQNQSIIIDEPISHSYPVDAGINPGYNHDEEYIINAPPPSYEEVMRQPEIYPKVQEIKGGT